MVREAILPMALAANFFEKSVSAMLTESGQSGSGKSTLLYILGGLDTPTSGAVFLNGIDMSGGQQQRAAIARALIGRPQILFADEPAGNLDSRTGADIMNLLQKINRESRQTIIMVTHSPEAAKSSSRMITVIDGVIA